MELNKRPRRLRKSPVLRELVQETEIKLSELIFPLFLFDSEQLGSTPKQKIDSMPGIYRYSQESILQEISECLALSIKTFVLFPVVDSRLKDQQASQACSKDNFLNQTLTLIKSRFPEVCLITDVALDPYTLHGHDGILDQQTGEILNDQTVEVLAEMALLQARAGADIVAPSDMMDGRVRVIRESLERANFQNTLIMSYAAKFASSLYGPFRDALGSSLALQTDKKSYQLNPANAREACREVLLDEEEGADLLIIKPALFYLDIIQRVRDLVDLPIVAYSVSGEYAMLEASFEKNYLARSRKFEILEESFLAFKRAGAKAVITYHAKEFAKLKAENKDRNSLS